MNIDNSKITIQTTRFGAMIIDKKRIIHFPNSLLGFPEQKNYIIFEHKQGSPFLWLQSTTAPHLAFVIINPYLIKQDYLQNIGQKKLFEEIKKGKLVIFAIVTIDANNPITMNLMGPIIIDIDAHIGEQMILADSGYNVEQPLIVPCLSNNKSTQASFSSESVIAK